MTQKEEYVKMTNVKFVKEIMSYSQYGSMSQIVLIQAIEGGLKRILANKKAGMKQYEEDSAKGINHLVSAPAWFGAAEELADKFQLKYGEWKIKTEK